MCVCACVCVCVCVCEGGREGGRERERMMKNSKQEMENLIVLLSHSKRERVYVFALL